MKETIVIEHHRAYYGNIAIFIHKIKNNNKVRFAIYKKINQMKDGESMEIVINNKYGRYPQFRITRKDNVADIEEWQDNSTEDYTTFSQGTLKKVLEINWECKKEITHD